MTTSGITVFGQPSQPNHGAGGRIAMDDALFPTDYVALDLETTGFTRTVAPSRKSVPCACGRGISSINSSSW